MVASKLSLDDPAIPWAVLDLFPRQGNWTEDEYFLLNRLTNRYVELCAGRIEVLEMPNKTHQKIIAAVLRMLEDYCAIQGGEVIASPYPLRTGETTYREPDLLVALPGNVTFFQEDFAEKADVVVEVLSQDRNRDLVVKRQEYARAGVREYWLIDPREKSVSVLNLQNSDYTLTRTGQGENVVASSVLPGFQLKASALPFKQ